MKQLSLFAVFAVILFATTGCLKDRDPGNTSNSDAGYVSNLDLTFDLEETVTYTDDFETLLNSTRVYNNAHDFASDPEISADLSGQADMVNTNMATAGFDNFEFSDVHRTQDATYFYSVFRSEQNTSGNRDMCMAFMKDGDEEPITIIEGPGTVGTGITLSVAGDDFSSDELQQMFVPTREQRQGFGNFNEGMTTARYTTQAGEVTIDYFVNDGNTGVITVQASGKVGEGNAARDYEIDHRWTVNF